MSVSADNLSYLKLAALTDKHSQPSSKEKHKDVN